MAGPLKVFVSSTMKDLANERAAVVQELLRLNYEPVNAEGILPTGGGSWAVIADELKDCDIVVLVLGESYGWVPTSGPYADSDQSVTEIEYREAIRLELPVLPFFKRLGYDAPRDTDQAKRRDAFRRQVAAWDTGHFRAEFELALDLAPLVGQSIGRLLAATWREMVELRPAAAPASSSDPAVADTGHHVPVPKPATISGAPLPDDLVQAVADRSAVLFAGAGMSLQAGLPSAYALTQYLLGKINEVDPLYQRGAHGGDFNDVASDLARLIGSIGLSQAVADMMGSEALIEPSIAQQLAVEAFDLVVTTNWDTLLERADRLNRLIVVADETAAVPGSALVKLHGTIDQPTGLVVTAEDLDAHDRRRRHVIEAVRQQMSTRPVIVVGSSLRDPTTIRLFTDRAQAPTGWFVAPLISEVDSIRVRALNLEPLVGTAESFFAALALALGSGPMPGDPNAP
ncbi:DUF4062 domain-containing protein [Nocardioides sp. GXZ039]|uniref:DUF4062 domain-containing protein n=1 Tax=Nocardioides sp. GXZ039 TaxID=3136018 RepID=UPI0030F4A752